MGIIDLAGCRRTAAALLVAAILPAPIHAHELAPAIADLALADRGDSTLTLTLNIEAVLAGLGPDHDSSESGPLSAAYAELRTMSPDALADRLRAEMPPLVALRAAGAPVVLGAPEIAVPPPPEADVPRESTLRYAFDMPSGTKTLIWAFEPDYGPSVIRLMMPGASDPTRAELVSPGESATIVLDRPLRGGLPLWLWAAAAFALVAGFAALWRLRRPV